jgi:hypothetical protein
LGTEFGGYMEEYMTKDDFRGSLDEAAAAGVVGQDTRLLRRMVLGSLHWSVQWFRRDGGDSVDALAERMLKLVIGPRPQAD